jgi:hypothetical protein
MTKAKAKTAKRPHGAKAMPKRPANGKSKTAVVLAMLRRPNGCTRAQVLSMIDWQAISFQQLAKAAGVKLRVDESKRPFVYGAV